MKIPGSRGGVNSGRVGGPDGSVGGCHSGGALGMTAEGPLLLSVRRLPSCWANSKLPDTCVPQPPLGGSRWALLMDGMLRKDADASFQLLFGRGTVAAPPALQGRCFSRLL